MNFRVYRQNSVLVKNSIVVYSGEDARPYVDDALIMVADGLGGTGAIRQLSVVKELFDRETVIQALFKDMYEKAEDEVFAEYVKDSFVELYSLKDVYDKEHPFVLKKSSYYGSRIVCSILLYHFLHDTEWNVEQIFSEFAACEEASKKDYLTQLGGKVATVIKEDIAKIAENANIIYESSLPRLKLLATTLCATIVHEHDDFVEAIYFLVGDSRPYMWSESEGLCQVIEDQEGIDGAMNGCIHFGGDFSVTCQHFTFKKPCVLFNASDGCFESGKFLSPMAFEKLLLDAINENDSIESIENKLISDYDTYGTHDDSSTLAMRCFGYESLDAFKAACRKRIDTLNADYLSKLEDLLTTDYIYSYDNCIDTLKSNVIGLRDRIVSDSGVRGFCANCILKGEYPESYGASEKIANHYSDKIRILDDAIAEQEACVRVAELAFQELISENFIYFRDCMGIPLRKSERYLIDSISSAKTNYDHAEEEYWEQIKTHKQSFDFACSDIQEMMDSICEIDVQNSSYPLNTDSFDKIKECKHCLNDLLEFLFDIKTSKHRCISKMKINHKAYVEKNKILASNYQSEIEKFCKDLVSKLINLPEIPELESVMKRIGNEVETIRTAKAQIEVLNGDEKDKVLNESLSLMIENDFASIFIVLGENKHIADQELLDEISKILDEYKKQVLSIKEKAELQKYIFVDYEARYNKYMCEV